MLLIGATKEAEQLYFTSFFTQRLLKVMWCPRWRSWKTEAYIMLAAAADTTGNALTIAAYNVVRNTRNLQTLNGGAEADVS